VRIYTQDLHYKLSPTKGNEPKLSLSIEGLCSFVLKILLFCSNHQIQHSQSNCMKERCAREPPAEWVNWRKWSWSTDRSAEEIPTQDRTRHHKGAKIRQEMNKWCAVSAPPQPVAQRLTSGGIMWRLTKLSLVGNLLRSNRQTITDTFRGICWCQIKSDVTACRGHPTL
jgi:hypothetical protein